MHHVDRTVTVTRNGEEALEVYRTSAAAGRPFAAIILDLTIPGGMGGTEVVSEIRNTDAHVPVFVSSGYADDPIMASPEDRGFTDSPRKPFRKEELAKLFERHLGARGRQ